MLDPLTAHLATAIDLTDNEVKLIAVLRALIVVVFAGDGDAVLDDLYDLMLPYRRGGVIAERVLRESTPEEQTTKRR